MNSIKLRFPKTQIFYEPDRWTVDAVLAQQDFSFLKLVCRNCIDLALYPDQMAFMHHYFFDKIPEMEDDKNWSHQVLIENGKHFNLGKMLMTIVDSTVGLLRHIIKRMVCRLHRKFSIGPWPQFFWVPHFPSHYLKTDVQFFAILLPRNQLLYWQVRREISWKEFSILRKFWVQHHWIAERM